MSHPNKTFIHAIELFHAGHRSFKKFFTDNRLSFTERALLRALSDIRANRYQSVINKVSKLSVFNTDLIQGVRDIILGVAHNNTGDFKKAISLYLAAIPLINKEQNIACSFMLYYNYFVTSSNLLDINHMSTCVEYFKSNRFQILRQEIARDICLFFYYSFIEDFTECCNLMRSIESQRDSMSEATWNNYLIFKFNFYVKQEDFANCRKVLKDLSQIRTFKCIENYKFMQIMLDHVEHGHPVYAYPRDFKTVPILLSQIMIIKSLEVCDIENAESFWKNIQEVYPHLYKNSFEFTGQKCLFSLALAKHKAAVVDQNIHRDHISVQKNKVVQLWDILQHARHPVFVGEIYEIIYQQKYNQEKEQARKIQVLMFKLKKKYSVEVSFHRNHYKLTTFKFKEKKLA